MIRSRNNGSITVEMALVFPVILLSVTAVIFIGMLGYQRLSLKSICDKAVQMSAISYDNPSKSMESGFIDKMNLDDEPLYLNLLNKKSTIKDKINHYIDRRISNYNLFPVNEYSVEIDVKNYLVYKMIILDIETEYAIPTGRLLSASGIDSNYLIKVRSKYIINDPVEFINNTDMIADVGERTGIKEKLDDGVINPLRKAFEPLAEAFEKLSEKITDFLK